MMDNFLILLIIIIIILIILCLFKKEHFDLSYIKKIFQKEDKDQLNKQIEIPDYKIYEEEELSNYINRKYKMYNNLEDYFTPSQFHPDYIDLINYINDNYKISSPHENKNIFNKDNKATILNDNPSVKEINKIGEILEKYVIYLNKELEKTKYSINPNKWENRIEENYKDGFQKVQEILGLPQSLYNKSTTQGELILEEYYGLKSEKVINNNDIKYIVYILLKRLNTRDKILLKLKFITNEEKRILIDDITIIGIDNNRPLKQSYSDMNNYYNYKSLNTSNLISSSDILDELELKHNIREKVMQQSINNLHPEDKFMHMRINPYNYNGYKTTRTLYDDINDKPLWGSYN